jgi:acyl carrier protein
MVLAANCKNTEDVVDYLTKRFFTTPVDQDTKKLIADFLGKQLGTNNIKEAETFSEEAMRETFHLLLSLPEYQLG